MKMDFDDNKKPNFLNMKHERDLQGKSGGGCDSKAYDNVALVASSETISLSDIGQFHDNYNHHHGSNNFMVIEKGKTSCFEDTTELLKSAVPYVKAKMKSACRKKMIYKRLPILNWLPHYNTEDAVGDLVAGITVGLTVIPQALAYANIAGLPPQYGLYSSFLGCFLYIIFGSCKDVPMGPTAIASLLTYQAIKGKGPEYAILCTFLGGVVHLLMALFGLGFLIDFVSGPVASGFTSAVALIIITSQVKDILGIKARGSGFVDSWISIFSNIRDTNLWDTVFGFICIFILLAMRIISTVRIGPKDELLKSKKQKITNKIIWLIGTSRNAILVIICGVIGYIFCLNGEPPFKVTGFVPAGLPSVQPPPFGFIKVENETNVTVTFVEMVSGLGYGIIVVPLVGLLEDIAICKAFANGKTVDATQELIAIGVSNVLGSFVQSFPITGSLSRSAVNNSSGVRTPLGGLYTGILVIVALLFCTPYFYYIPKSSLAAIIIAAVIFMVEVKVVKPMWRTKKTDLVPGITTFVACLVLPLEVGILVGIGVNLLFILYHAARPKISVEKLLSREGVEFLMLTPDRCLIFPSVDYVRNLVTKHSIRQGIPVVIDCSHIYGADYTAATLIDILTQDFAARDQPLLFYNVKPSVSAVFEGLLPKDFTVFYNEEDIDILLKKKSKAKHLITV